MKHALPLCAASLFALSVQAETRGLGAHEHGHGALNIAFEGDAVLMELEAPGADIVGFEHTAESAEDRAAIDAAVAALAKPMELFVPDAAAGCVVTAAKVELVTEGGAHEEDHQEHGHDEHGRDADKHDDHDHDADKHAEDEHQGAREDQERCAER